MKAFLSHSSKDKAFVRAVGALLGDSQCEYDEYTFEYTLNTAAIHRALQRCEVFVFFLSENSINSAFIKEEQRIALEARGKGFLKQIIIFVLDNTSYRQLPSWLQDINVVQRLSSPKACARRIQSTLIAIDAEYHSHPVIYIPREEQEKALRRALSAPPGTAPVAIHAVGHYGIGRRTFLRHSLATLFPRTIDSFVEITIARYHGVEELYRALYSLHKVASRVQIAQDFMAFTALSEAKQVNLIVEIIIEIAENTEFVLINDDGGVYDDSGDYQPHLRAIIAALSRASRPLLGFVQTRMMPHSLRVDFKSAYHTFLRPFNDEQTKDLLSLSLKQAGVDFTATQLDDIADHLDGHPFNVQFAVTFAANYGVDSLIADPSELIEWKRRRAEDFLRKIEFNQTDADIMATLSEHRFMASDMMLTITIHPIETAQSLRRLEDHCCIERRGGYFHISAPIREAVVRDRRFVRPDDWYRSIAASISDALAEYKDEDFVPVAIIESATVAAAHGADASPLIGTLILPSHLLSIARDSYDRGKRKLCLEFCKRAYDMKGRLTLDAQVELLRLWGLSAIRENEVTLYKEVVAKLRNMPSNLATRVGYFLEGFYLRLHHQIDAAEERFLQAWQLGKRNSSINRELASLYCKQKRYTEAEEHARATYEVAPTNPFIIDVLVETILGKLDLGLAVDRAELARLLEELKIYGDAPGSSFYLIRDAQRRARERDFSGALSAVTKAIERTPALLAPYFLRADIRLRMNDVPGAEQDLVKIEELLTDIATFSERDEAQVHELQARILMEKKQFGAAKRKIEQSAFLPQRVAARLLQTLSRIVGFEPDFADAELKEWAKVSQSGITRDRRS